MWTNQAMCSRTAPRGYGEIHQWIKTKTGLSMKDARWISFLFVFLFPVNNAEEHPKSPHPFRPDNANGRVGMNSALTISANCCFALFRSRRCVCCCFCCCCQRRSAQGSAWKGLLGELLSRPGLPTCTCTGRSQGESVGGCSSGNFSWRGWGCKLLEPGGESADYQLMWAGLTISLKSTFTLCGFSFFTLYGDTKKKKKSLLC